MQHIRAVLDTRVVKTFFHIKTENHTFILCMNTRRVFRNLNATGPWDIVLSRIPCFPQHRISIMDTKGPAIFFNKYPKLEKHHWPMH